MVVNKIDMRRLLVDLGRVRYIHLQEGKLISQGEGDVLEVFANPHRSTLVANHALYLNVYSFDYLDLKQSKEQETYFDLVQDSRCLRLIPLSTPLQQQTTRTTTVGIQPETRAHLLRRIPLSGLSVAEVLPVVEAMTSKRTTADDP